MVYNSPKTPQEISSKDVGWIVMKTTISEGALVTVFCSYFEGKN